MQIIDEIAAAFEGFDTPYLKIADRAEAIHRAVALTKAGDLLVLAGKGHENYQLIGSEKRPFCEREILLDAIKALR
jgi:UDP-N-acetylmuramoyl-L-alanyl-D-glutamate--2,6-diaminopimelate ligase